MYFPKLYLVEKSIFSDSQKKEFDKYKKDSSKQRNWLMKNLKAGNIDKDGLYLGGFNQWSETFQEVVVKSLEEYGTDTSTNRFLFYINNVKDTDIVRQKGSRRDALMLLMSYMNDPEAKYHISVTNSNLENSWTTDIRAFVGADSQVSCMKIEALASITTKDSDSYIKEDKLRRGAIDAILEARTEDEVLDAPNKASELKSINEMRNAFNSHYQDKKLSSKYFAIRELLSNELKQVENVIKKYPKGEDLNKELDSLERALLKRLWQSDTDLVDKYFKYRRKLDKDFRSIYYLVTNKITKQQIEQKFQEVDEKSKKSEPESSVETSKEEEEEAPKEEEETSQETSEEPKGTSNSKESSKESEESQDKKPEEEVSKEVLSQKVNDTKKALNSLLKLKDDEFKTLTQRIYKKGKSTEDLIDDLLKTIGAV